MQQDRNRVSYASGVAAPLKRKILPLSRRLKTKDYGRHSRANVIVLPSCRERVRMIRLSIISVRRVNREFRRHLGRINISIPEVWLKNIKRIGATLWTRAVSKCDWQKTAFCSERTRRTSSIKDWKQESAAVGCAPTNMAVRATGATHCMVVWPQQQLRLLSLLLDVSQWSFRGALRAPGPA